MKHPDTPTWAHRLGLGAMAVIIGMAGIAAAVALWPAAVAMAEIFLDEPWLLAAIPGIVAKVWLLGFLLDLAIYDEDGYLRWKQEEKPDA